MVKHHFTLLMYPSSIIVAAGHTAGCHRHHRTADAVSGRLRPRSVAQMHASHQIEQRARHLIGMLDRAEMPAILDDRETRDVPVIASASARIAGLGLNGSLSPHSTAAGAVTSGS